MHALITLRRRELPQTGRYGPCWRSPPVGAVVLMSGCDVGRSAL